MKKIDKSENLIRLPASQFLQQWPSVHQSTGLPCLKENHDFPTDPFLRPEGRMAKKSVKQFLGYKL